MIFSLGFMHSTQSLNLFYTILNCLMSCQSSIIATALAAHVIYPGITREFDKFSKMVQSLSLRGILSRLEKTRIYTFSLSRIPTRKVIPLRATFMDRLTNGGQWMGSSECFNYGRLGLYK